MSIISMATTLTYAATIPVKFHFDPPEENFQKVFIASTFNGWNNASHEMLDPDHDGIFETTLVLAEGTHEYKFVLDSDWGLAYTDPDNHLINTQNNNNSVIVVVDPMVYYVLPKHGSIDTVKAGQAFSADFSWSDGNPIDPATLSVAINGIALANPVTYYDQSKREFSYKPSQPLDNGNHNFSISVSSPVGSASFTSEFERNIGLIIYKIRKKFEFDTNSSLFSFTGAVTKASLVGTFNSWNNRRDVMADADGDGLWSVTTEVEAGYHEYKFYFNDGIWTSDPDDPHMNRLNNLNSYFTAVADSTPQIELLEPSEGRVFSEAGPVPFRFFLNPGARGWGVIEGSIAVRQNGLALPVQFNATSGELSGALELNAEGIYELVAEFTNGQNVKVQKSYSFGYYAPKSGYHYVDGIGDEPYSYPASVPEHSADIKAVHINAVPTSDSLLFTIEMGDITDNTRWGFTVAKELSDVYSPAPNSLELETPQLGNTGIFCTLSVPGSAYYDANKENRLQVGKDSGVYGPRVEVNPDALTTNRLSFRISTVYLDSLLGTYTHPRYFGLYSYIVTNAGSAGYEVTVAEGGIAQADEPDVYDVAFVRSSDWQNRLLSNYILPGGDGGPRTARLDAPGRGFAKLAAADISENLTVSGPIITFLTPATTYWKPALTLHGAINDSAITTATMIFNGVSSDIPIAHGGFGIDLTLKEGKNTVLVSATDRKGFTTTTDELALVLELYKQPSLRITGDVQGRNVSLTAQAFSPVGLDFVYAWAPDAANPAPITLSSKTTPATSFVMPAVDGVYYIIGAVRDKEGRIARGKRYVTAKGDSVWLNDINDHVAWIDDAVVYEIYPHSFGEYGVLGEITAKVPQLAALGVDAIWLTPIFEGPTEHGYEITDYYAIEPDLGTVTQFKDLVNAAHAAGIKVILDFVANHTSVQHPFMQNVLEYHQYSPWANWYIWDGMPGASAYEFLFDWGSLPNLNMNDAEVRDYFIHVAEYWIRNYDVDGYRCDVAWGVQQRNAQFWQEWRQALKAIKPEIFLLAEAAAQDTVYFDKRFDSAYDWDLRTKLFAALDNPAQIDALHTELSREYPTHARPFRFIENHDEDRMIHRYDAARAKLAATIIMTSPGIPLIYAGQEVGELTSRGKIDWSDPNNLLPFYKKLIDLRQCYVHQPRIRRIPNSTSGLVYSYRSEGTSALLITAANFSPDSTSTTMDWSSLSVTSGTTYFVNDLLAGTSLSAPAENLTNWLVKLAGFEAKVLLISTEPVSSVSPRPGTESIPERFSLKQNYPNPFNPSTTISYDLPKESKVVVKVFNSAGQYITTLVDELKTAGSHLAIWNATDHSGLAVAAGVYFVQLEAEGFVETRKILLLK